MAHNEASNQIEKVLNEAIAEMEDYEDGDILVEWAVVCFVTNPNQDKEDSYPMLFSNGTIPTYRARGLFTTAMKFLDQ